MRSSGLFWVWVVVSVALTAVGGCSEDEEGAVVLGSKEGPPVPIEDTGPVGGDVDEPAPCDSLECCIEQTGITPSPCLDVKLLQGVCKPIYADAGAPCGGDAICGGVATCDGEGECTLADGVTDCDAVETDACQAAACDEESGEGVISAVLDGTLCSDGDACNGSETCSEGACEPGEALSCDDGNACTTDSCDGESGCTWIPAVGESCSDGNVCTHDDSCDADGQCAGTGNVCPCTTDEECNGKAGQCEAALVCADGECVPGPGGDNKCDDGDPCTDDDCNSETGECSFTPNNSLCNDNDPCTAKDTCSDGVCGGIAKLCDDGDPCTAGDVCDGVTGECLPGVYECEACETAADCPALPPCGGEYACQNNGCVLIEDSAVDCDAIEPGPCKTVACDAESNQCVESTLPDGAGCDDGDLCTEGDTCKAGECVAGGAVDCNDDKACTDDWCAAGFGCVYAPTSGAACTDNNECTTADTCNNGVCEGAAPLSCDDGNPCTLDNCNPVGGCAPTPQEGLACDDGDGCTAGDTCSAAGTCTPGKNTCGCTTNLDCLDDGDLCNGVPACVDAKCINDPATAVVCLPTDDLGPCQVNECAPESGECVAVPIATGTACDDGDQCTVGDVCKNGTCDGNAKICDDGNACTTDACDKAQGCLAEPFDGPCDDKNACTQGEVCVSGKCQGGGAVSCSDANVCTSDACLPKTGCKYSPAVGACNDGDACTNDDACKSGKCVGTVKVCEPLGKCEDAACDATSGQCVPKAVSCSDGDGCTEDACDPATGDCLFKPKSCDDGDKCTLDSCDPTTTIGCVATPTKCDDGLACTTDACDPSTGECVSAAIVCDDSEPCTNDACIDGACVFSPVDCNDNDKCTKDSCDGVCQHAPVACDDLNACTENGCTAEQGCIFNPITCDDDNPCTNDSCTPATGCAYPAVDCDDGVACTVDYCDDEGDCVHVATDSLCDDGDDCTDTWCDGGCITEVICGPCDDKVAGEPCEDDDQDTIGDFCLDEVCRGFTVHKGYPADAGVSPRLDKVTWTGGDFYATGSDATGEGQSWVAQINGPDINVITPTIQSDTQYNAMTDYAVFADNGQVAALTDEGWVMDSQLANLFEATPGLEKSGVKAAWGQVVDGEGTYYISGRSKFGTFFMSEASWILKCVTAGGGNCSLQTVAYDDFIDKEVPRALTGWGLDGDSEVGTVLLTDYKTSGDAFFNDAFAHETLSSSKPWDLSYFDKSSSATLSRDVHGTADDNVWWGGSFGLIRGRYAQGNGNVAWSNLSGVIPFVQLSYDFNGVWADDEVVLYAANRYKFTGMTLSLVTHPVDSDHASAANWRVIELMNLAAVAPCIGGLCLPGFEPQDPGSFQDVWVNDGTVVVTGWIYDKDTGTTQALHLIRQP